MSEAMNEAIRTLSAEEAIELIGTHIEGRLNGGPNRKAEDMEIGRQADLDVEMISARWDEAERIVQVSLPPIEVEVLPSAPPAAAKKISQQLQLPAASEPEPQPAQRRSSGVLGLVSLSGFDPDRERYTTAKARAKPPEKNAVADDGPPKTEAAQNVSGLGEANVVWKLPKLATAPELSRKAPFDNAKQFTRDKLEYSAEGCAEGDGEPISGTYFYEGDWWQWNGAFYEKAPEQRIIDMACNYMDGAAIKTDEGRARFKPTTRDLTSLMTFLKSSVGLDDKITPPRWLDERTSPTPEGLLAFHNCLVDVTTGKTYPHEPRLWIHDGVDFDYDPKARCPRWERFLAELFPKDDEARETIEEQLGYGMTIDNQFEKAALWIGAPRSGRGTLAHIQELLVGHNGYTSLNIHTWHNNENSRMGIVGKRVGIFHDMRLKPAKQFGNAGYDTGGVDPQSQQLLLELISGDLTEIGRKYLAAWKGKPFIKFVLISNKVPNFNDDVLVTRFNVLEFKESFLGRENPALKRELLPAELPGIANRCLAAYRRLLQRGRFVQPQSGLALLGKVKAMVGPWAAFMDTYWEPDPMGQGTLISVFNKTFREWCLETQTFDLVSTSSSNIIQQIKRLPKWQWLKAWRPAATDGEANPRRYRVKLKPGAELPDNVKNWLDAESWGTHEDPPRMRAIRLLHGGSA